jgi:hypothetical protein
LLQRLLERPDSGLTLRIVRDGVHLHTDPPHLLRLLRTRDDWSCARRATQECNEFPSPHGFARARDYIGYEKNITFLD